MNKNDLEININKQLPTQQWVRINNDPAKKKQLFTTMVRSHGTTTV